MNYVPVVIVLAGLLVAPPGQAANPALDALAAAPANVFLGEARRSTGKSFLDHMSTTYVEEPPYFVPATFPGLLVAPRREPDTPSMLLACFGLLLYLGWRRGKALGAAF